MKKAAGEVKSARLKQSKPQKVSLDKARLQQAGKIMHDDVAPLLVAAGLRLQLVRMDHPETKAEVDHVLGILDQAVERIRALSQELSPSPFAAPSK